MGRLQWYKRDPYDALQGMLELTLEETGAYSKIIDLIYLHENDLRDDERYIVGWLKCDLRVWKRLRARLISLKKIAIEDGRIVNFRATTELEKTGSGKRSPPSYPPKSETYGVSYPPKSDTSTPSHPPKSEHDPTISTTCDGQNREDKKREEKNPPYPPLQGGRKSERNSENGSGRQAVIRQQRHTLAGSFQQAVAHLEALEPQGGDRDGSGTVVPIPRLRHGST